MPSSIGCASSRRYGLTASSIAGARGAATIVLGVRAIVPIALIRRLSYRGKRASIIYAFIIMRLV